MHGGFEIMIKSSRFEARGCNRVVSGELQPNK